MRVRVLEDVCQGHTLCAVAAPEIFDLREEDGHAVVRVADVPSDQQAAVERAVVGCPEGAIVVD